MKYDDTYSMIGAMLNQGFETEFKKQREKKEKRRRFFKELNDRSRSDCVHEQVAKRIANVRFTVMISRLKKNSGNISENMSNSAGKCKCDAHTICTCAVDCGDRM